LALKRAAFLLFLLLGNGCSKKVEPPRRTEPWLANPSASAGVDSPSGPLRFDVLAESVVRFSVPTRRAKIGGSVPLASGNLELDVRDLSRSKASLTFDLTRLSVAADSLPRELDLGGAEPNALALQWLELGAEVPSERRQQFSQARFELSALEDVTGNLELGSSKPSARVTATAVGSLLLHGFRAPVRTRVALQPLPSEAPGQPHRLSIRTVEPVVLSLAAHDIAARSAAGVGDAALTARVADVVGKSARVELELVAQAVK
jgi:hypothetical protein